MGTPFRGDNRGGIGTDDGGRKCNSLEYTGGRTWIGGTAGEWRGVLASSYTGVLILGISKIKTCLVNPEWKARADL